jgi:hypothetical protein
MFLCFCLHLVQNDRSSQFLVAILSDSGTVGTTASHFAECKGAATIIGMIATGPRRRIPVDFDGSSQLVKKGSQSSMPRELGTLV